MKKPADDTPLIDTPPAASPEATDTAEPAFDPNHEWPSQGGSYVRQPDGTLKRED